MDGRASESKFVEGSQLERLPCPCCGYFTVQSDDKVIVEICDVCFWQYDEVAHAYPSRSIGANHVSLLQARENYRKDGASELQFKHLVREPIEEELPENNR